MTAIIRSTPEDDLVPHRENILAVHNRYLILKRLDELVAPTYMGGYPTALFFSPRVNQVNLPANSFGDIDIFPEDEKRAVEIVNAVASLSPVKRDNSSWATTFHFEPNIVIQVITRQKTLGLPEDTLTSFDFVNCAIAYKPSNGYIWFHKDAINAFINKEIQLLNPWLFDADTDKCEQTYMEPRERYVAQLLRIKKYADRWGLLFSKESLDRILELYDQYPLLEVSKDRLYPAGSGGKTVAYNITGNIWSTIAPIIRHSPGFTASRDKHGVFTGTTPSGKLRAKKIQTPIKLKNNWTPYYK